VTKLIVTGCDSDNYRLFDSVTMKGHLHLELILQGGWMRKTMVVVATFQL
jgi:hypothetical protein